MTGARKRVRTDRPVELAAIRAGRDVSRHLRAEAHSPSITREVVDLRSLAAVASEVARQQGAPLTRDAYGSVYRAFCRFAGPDVGAEALTPEAVRAYRDLLEREGRSPATIAKG